MSFDAFTQRTARECCAGAGDSLLADPHAAEPGVDAPQPDTVRNLLVFADDWGRHPSSSQHLMAHLMDRYQVYWVNTIGTRAPRLDLATFRRGWEKTRQWLWPGRLPAPNATARRRDPRVLNPKMWPWFATAWSRWINRRLLVRQLTRVLRDLPEPTVAVTMVPVVADLVGYLPVQRWVYYCVDDLSEWPGLDQETLRRMEDRLLTRVDRVIAVSRTLQDRLRRKGRDSGLLTHGVDLDHWAVSAGEAGLPALEGLERPLIVFWGMIDPRMDGEFVTRLAQDLERGTILLVGPAAHMDPSLLAPSRVKRLPAQEFALLPRLAHEAAVLIMPYTDMPVTRAIQPLKLKEYLATGKPAVVRDLPSTRDWSDCLDLADSPETFSRLVRLRLETGLPGDQQQARARLASESWTVKASQFEQLALEC
jgi:glycosyltransferase involved in cell wall biosynthesis